MSEDGDRSQDEATDGSLFNRSAITNGSTILPGIDGRSAPARRVRDVQNAILADLGGSERVTEAERLIVRRASFLELKLERIEREFLLNEEINIELLDSYQRAANTQRRAFETVGLERRAKDVTPDLQTYLHGKNGSKCEVVVPMTLNTLSTPHRDSHRVVMDFRTPVSRVDSQ